MSLLSQILADVPTPLVTCLYHTKPGSAKPLLQSSAYLTSQASVVFSACVPCMSPLLRADHDLQTKGLSGTALYFALARGADGATALDMSKHFDSNYHSLVSRAQKRDRFWPFWRKRERRLTCRLWAECL